MNFDTQRKWGKYSALHSEKDHLGYIPALSATDTTKVHYSTNIKSTDLEKKVFNRKTLPHNLGHNE